MTQTTNEIDENAVRDLRDAVYGHKTSFKNWEACKEHRMTPDQTKWLQSQAEKEKHHANNKV